MRNSIGGRRIFRIVRSGKDKMRIHLPDDVKYIIKTLTEAGFEAYAVGGCIRDAILGREPDDWDITTSAAPAQVKELFPHTIDTGIQHGTVTVMWNHQGFEVTTYRIDGKYEDGRHPEQVIFTPSLTEDLRRRDFTMNAIAYNEREGLVDIFGGLDDMENKVIRCVGNADRRFGEDALRIMRAIRFSAQLGYEIEAGTKAAAARLAPELSRVSAERIQAELVKLVTSDHPDYLRQAYETGITAVILPEFDKMMQTPQNHPHHCYNVGEHTLRSMREVPGDKLLRLTMLLHDIGKPETLSIDRAGISHCNNHARVGEKMTRDILKRLKFDNDTITYVSRLVLYHDYGNSKEPDRKIVRRAIHKIGEDIFPLLFSVKRADIMAQSDFMREEKLTRLQKWADIYTGVIKDAECISLKTLAVDGNDLINAGIKPGKELGEILNRMLDMVLEHPEYNNKEYLLSRLLK